MCNILLKVEFKCLELGTRSYACCYRLVDEFAVVDLEWQCALGGSKEDKLEHGSLGQLSKSLRLNLLICKMGVIVVSSS